MDRRAPRHLDRHANDLRYQAARSVQELFELFVLYPSRSRYRRPRFDGTRQMAFLTLLAIKIEPYRDTHKAVYTVLIRPLQR